MTNIRKSREMLMWRFRVAHCGDAFLFSGRPSKNSDYICQKCRRKMRITLQQIRTRKEADLILRNNGNFREKCADCGSICGHHVVYDKGLDAYFLRCSRCGEELREVDKKELT